MYHHLEVLAKVLVQLPGVGFHLELKLLKLLFKCLLDLVSHGFHFGPLVCNLLLENFTL